MKKLLLLILSVVFLIKPGLVQAYVSPAISFSLDQATVNVSYDSYNYIIPRPVIPTLSFPTTGKTTYVSPGQSIQTVINTASPGDIIYVRAGIYQEQIFLQNVGSSSLPVVLSSAPGDLGKVTISLPSSVYQNLTLGNSWPSVITVSGGNTFVWVNGLNIEGYKGKSGAPATTNTFDADGITFSNGSGNSKITNNVVYNNLHCGIKEMNHGGVNITLEGNVVFENGIDSRDHGIYAPMNNSTMNGNVVFNNVGWGIHSYEKPQGQTITKNVLFGNGEGGIILAGANTTVTNNTSVYNTRGLFYFRGDSRDNSVNHNIFAFNDVNGDYDFGGDALQSYPSNNTDDYNVYYPKTSMDPNPRILPLSHEIYVDPGFVSPTIGNFRLTANSSAQEMGAYNGGTVLAKTGIINFRELLQTLVSIFDYNNLIKNFGK